jgi:hypothetical protein
VGDLVGPDGFHGMNSSGDEAKQLSVVGRCFVRFKIAGFKFKSEEASLGNPSAFRNGSRVGARDDGC